MYSLVQNFVFAFALILFCNPVIAQTQPETRSAFREFTDASGKFKVRAIFIGSVAERAILQREDGTEFIMKLSH